MNTKLAWNSRFFYASELPPLHLSRQAASENWKHQFLRLISESLYCFLCLQSALFYYFRSLIIKLLSTQNSLIFQYCIFWDTNDFVEQHGWLDSTCFFLLLTFLYLGSILHRFLFLLVFIYSTWLLYFFFFSYSHLPSVGIGTLASTVEQLKWQCLRLYFNLTSG